MLISCHVCMWVCEWVCESVTSLYEPPVVIQFSEHRFSAVPQRQLPNLCMCICVRENGEVEDNEQVLLFSHVISLLSFSFTRSYSHTHTHTHTHTFHVPQLNICGFFQKCVEGSGVYWFFYNPYTVYPGWIYGWICVCTKTSPSAKAAV